MAGYLGVRHRISLRPQYSNIPYGPSMVVVDGRIDRYCAEVSAPRRANILRKCEPFHAGMQRLDLDVAAGALLLTIPPNRWPLPVGDLRARGSRGCRWLEPSIAKERISTETPALGVDNPQAPLKRSATDRASYSDGFINFVPIVNLFGIRSFEDHGSNVN